MEEPRSKFANFTLIKLKFLRGKWGRSRKNLFQALYFNVTCFHFFSSERNIKVDCISVSTSPVKSTIDDHIQQLFDALLTSLRRSITNDVQTIDSFLTSATDALSTRPQTVEEIDVANAKHSELATKKLQVIILCHAE